MRRSVPWVFRMCVKGESVDIEIDSGAEVICLQEKVAFCLKSVVLTSMFSLFATIVVVEN